MVKKKSDNHYSLSVHDMTNDEFLNIEKETLLQGAKYSLANAKAHYECAQESGKLMHYGISNSLLILSVEECVKCAVLLCGYFSINLPFKIDPIFYNHKEKHKQAADIQPLMEVIFSIKDIIQSIFKERKSAFHFALNVGFALIGVSLNKCDTDKEKITLWWHKANNLKNKGFYVSYKNNDWILPHNINEKAYQESVCIAKTFVEGLEFINDIKDDDYILFTKEHEIS